MEGGILGIGIALNHRGWATDSSSPHLHFRSRTCLWWINCLTVQARYQQSRLSRTQPFQTSKTKGPSCLFHSTASTDAPSPSSHLDGVVYSKPASRSAEQVSFKQRLSGSMDETGAYWTSQTHLYPSDRQADISIESGRHVLRPINSWVDDDIGARKNPLHARTLWRGNETSSFWRGS